jgi:hypothetical protein
MPTQGDAGAQHHQPLLQLEVDQRVAAEVNLCRSAVNGTSNYAAAQLSLPAVALKNAAYLGQYAVGA